MTEFIQIHSLTAYPPANLNRDDLGRPKTAMFGGTQRLRISSQSLKRAWRTSEVFTESVGTEALGTRTRDIGNKIYDELVDSKVDPERADAFAKRVAAVFGKLEKPKKGEDPRKSRRTGQLVHVSTAEWKVIAGLMEQVVAGQEPSDEVLKDTVGSGQGTADIALFGRMLAEHPNRNIEAAAQVAHALTCHSVTVEDDYFTAVDDLNTLDSEDGAGAAHLGTVEFGAGLFYHYICVNRDLLLRNLEDEAELANASLKGLVEACATVAPTGKQATFGSRARAHYMLLEKGSAQPRSLVAAYLGGVHDWGRSQDPLASAVSQLESLQDRMDTVYGACADARASFNVLSGQGSMSEVISFVSES